MLAFHQLEFRTSQVLLHSVVAVPKATISMEALLADMIVIVTKTKTKISLGKIDLKILFQSLSKVLLLQGRPHRACNSKDQDQCSSKPSSQINSDDSDSISHQSGSATWNSQIDDDDDDVDPWGTSTAKPASKA